MAKKKKKQPQGAPDWMVTYGDMMTLLLCFFVILVSMSEMKQDQKFQQVMESIKRAFGYQGGAGTIPGNTMPSNTTLKKLQQLMLRKAQLNEGKSTDQGIEGENISVINVREGLEFTIGGRISFELGKARLLDLAKQRLDEFVGIIQGLNNKLRIRGHTAQIPTEKHSEFDNLFDLSYARAQAVREYLITKGIRKERITIEACGATELLRVQAYDDEAKAANERVSIIVTENLVDQYCGAVPTDSRELLDG